MGAGGGDERDAARAAAAAAALEEIEPGTLIGVGSGRAVWAVVDLLGERLAAGGPPVRAVTASELTAARARGLGIEVVQPAGDTRLELAIDGADEVAGDLGLIKGGGGALLREKLVIGLAGRFVVVAEDAKRVERLGETFRLPVEVVRFAWESTRERVAAVVEDPRLRTGEDGEPFVTDEGHLILDCALPADRPAAEVGPALKAITGVVEHGLFLHEADVALLGSPDGGVSRLERR